MPRHLTFSLAVMRLSVGIFFLIWALEKVVAPGVAIRVAETFYGFIPSETALIITSLLHSRWCSVVFIAAFMLGLFKLVRRLPEKKIPDCAG
jgi:hypothetical protein